MRLNRETVQAVTALLAFVVAALHLWWGLPRFVLYASVGTMPDPRPLAFVLSGHAIAVGVTLVAAEAVDARRTYLPGMALMAAHVVGYAAWHTVLAHGFEPATEHTHVTPVTAGPIVLEHLVNSPLALVSKAAEVTVLVLLGWLLLAGRREDV